MRIIGGRLRGQKLVSFKAEHIRPTSDRVKETLFNVLMGWVEDARILDLFSGTGNLACECLSRGARSVDAVESHRGSLRIMGENFQKLGLDVRVHSQRAEAFLRSYRGEPFDLILMDPPFTDKLAHPTMELLAGNPKLYHADTVVAVERGGHEPISENYGPLFCFKTKDFGDKHLHFFQMDNQVDSKVEP